MFAIFFILMMASVGMFLFGMINPNYVKMGRRLRVAAISIPSTILFFIAAIVATPDSEPVVEDIMTIEEQQSHVKELSDAIFVRNASVTGVYEGIKNDMDRLSKEEITIYDMYNSADSAKTVASKAYDHIMRVDISLDIPKELRERLKDVRRDASSSFMSKRDAYESLMRFLDDQKPSDLNEFQDKMINSESYMLRAQNSLDEIEKEIGLSEEENEGAN